MVPGNSLDYVRREKPSKLTTLEQAVSLGVQDGDSVFLGYTSWSSAFEREIARQGKKNLTCVGAMGSALLPLAGCSSLVLTAYALGYPSRWFLDRMRNGEFAVEDYTNQALALMLLAGATGMPFASTRSMLGSEFFSRPLPARACPRPLLMESPLDGSPVVLLPPIRPSVSLVHVQWADEEGNAVLWGGQGEVKWALWASERVIISAEEIVPTEVLRSDPERVTVPGFMVDAVVHLPYGALPWGVPGYYAAASDFQAHYLWAMREEGAFREFMAYWVHECDSHEDFLARVVERYGESFFDELAVDRTWSPPKSITYGWRTAR